ncbi:unnamed protein product, partial [Rotaria sp. Silwood2]
MDPLRGRKPITAARSRPHPHRMPL